MKGIFQLLDKLKSRIFVFFNILTEENFEYNIIGLIDASIITCLEKDCSIHYNILENHGGLMERYHLEMLANDAFKQLNLVKFVNGHLFSG